MSETPTPAPEALESPRVAGESDGPPAERRPRAARRRKCIAVLTDYMTFFGGGYEAQVRDAFHAKCRELDLDLLLVFGRALEEPSSAAHNEIFDLMHRDRVDGVVIVSTSLASHAGPPSVRRLVDRLGTMPVASLGLPVPQVPSVLVDNRGGMSAVVEHLIEEHSCRRIVFIAGVPDNAEANARLLGYREVLERHGIPFDPALVVTGHFMTAGGRSAMEELLASGVDFDAVAAASDAMALGAIEALRKHRLRVPRDLPVTGFDDLAVARLGNPPLSTVAQPFDQMAEKSIELVLRQLNGEDVPLTSELPTEFNLRRSCGCVHGRRVRPDAFAERTSHDLAPAPSCDWAARVKPTLSALLRAGSKTSEDDADRLLNAAADELAGTRHAFTRVLEEMLDGSGGDNERYRALHNAVSCLREGLRGVADSAFDDVLFEALSSVAFANTTAQAQHRLEIDDAYHRFLRSGDHVAVAFDLPSLKQAFQRSLGDAGILTAFVSRWSADAPNELEPFACARDGEWVEPGGARYPGRELMPSAAWEGGERTTFLVFPLAFEAQRQGVVAFEYHPNTNGYQVLRDQLSAALMTVGLHQELVQKTMLHERSVQERLATSKRIESLSMLAGGVAHDLNNALGPMVALPEVIVAELGQLGIPRESSADMVADLESIRAAALRASQTIKDLLTLGRQGKTHKEPFDINKAILGCSFGAAAGPNRRVNVALDLTPEPLAVRGSESHVARAITNLVRNAIEASTGTGEVRLTTFATRVAEPITGYETVEPGDYVVVEVADDGEGIPSQEIGRVFEPFFSTKRMREHSGSGLGLAIVHGVVKEHDGFIDVTSTPGAGTTFTLYFPLTSEPVQSPESEPSPRGSAKILFVDDERIQRRTGARVLTHLGYAVDTLDSGQQALELFRIASAQGAQSPYDLVILDMLLNENEDGLAVFERILRLFPDQRAVIASGHAPNQRAAHAVTKGVCWLVKPYTRHALANAVDTALGQRARPPAG